MHQYLQPLTTKHGQSNELAQRHTDSEHDQLRPTIPFPTTDVLTSTPDRIDLPKNGIETRLRLEREGGASISGAVSVVIFYLDADSGEAVVEPVGLNEEVESESPLMRGKWRYVEVDGLPFSVVSRKNARATVGLYQGTLVRPQIDEARRAIMPLEFYWMKHLERPFSSFSFSPARVAKTGKGIFPVFPLVKSDTEFGGIVYLGGGSLAWRPIQVENPRPSVVQFAQVYGGDISMRWSGAGLGGQFEAKIMTNNEVVESRTLSGAGVEDFRGLPEGDFILLAGLRRFDHQNADEVLIKVAFEVVRGAKEIVELDFGPLSGRDVYDIQIQVSRNERVLEDWGRGSKGRVIEVLNLVEDMQLGHGAEHKTHVSWKDTLLVDDKRVGLQSKIFALEPGGYIARIPRYGVASLFYTDKNRSPTIDVSGVGLVSFHVRDALTRLPVSASRVRFIGFYECGGVRLQSSVPLGAAANGSFELLTGVQFARVEIETPTHGKIERAIEITSPVVEFFVLPSFEVHLILAGEQRPRGVEFGVVENMSFLADGVVVPSTSLRFGDLSGDSEEDFMCGRVVIVLEGARLLEVSGLPFTPREKAFDLSSRSGDRHVINLEDQ